MRASFSPAAFAALLAAGALFAVGRPAAAQTVVNSTQAPQFTVRVGGFFTDNSSVRHTVGSSFIAAGVDYDLHNEVGVSRTVISGDYIDRSSGGNDLRIIPVTIGQFAVGDPGKDVEPYFGGGVGAYFVHQDFGGNNRHDSASFGGYVGGGVVVDKFLDVDLRYHLVTSENGISPSGLELTAGVRF